jgi:hypothetical protein
MTLLHAIATETLRATFFQFPIDGTEINRGRRFLRSVTQLSGASGPLFDLTKTPGVPRCIALVESTGIVSVKKVSIGPKVTNTIFTTTGSTFHPKLGRTIHNNNSFVVQRRRAGYIASSSLFLGTRRLQCRA